MCWRDKSLSQLPAHFTTAGTDFRAPDSDVESTSGPQAISVAATERLSCEEIAVKENLANKIMLNSAGLCVTADEGETVQNVRRGTLRRKSVIMCIIYCLLEG